MRTFEASTTKCIVAEEHACAARRRRKASDAERS
jgi:hypothetical protein